MPLSRSRLIFSSAFAAHTGVFAGRYIELYWLSLCPSPRLLYLFAILYTPTTSTLHTLVVRRCFWVPVISNAFMRGFTLAQGSNFEAYPCVTIHLSVNYWIGMPTLRVYCKALAEQKAGLHSRDKTMGA